MVAQERPPRRLPIPLPGAVFSVLLVDLDDVLTAAIDRLSSEAARAAEYRRKRERDPEKATELALSEPFHLRMCSANAALHPRSLLDGIAREDPAGADTVIVVAPAGDVPYVKHKLGLLGRKNMVLALPIEEARLCRELLRADPTLAARVAIADAEDAFPAVGVSHPRFRRLAALVVDDDPSTAILFSAGVPHPNADVTLATTPMSAFEHVVSRPVDVLLVSTSMRSDGGEPFYRVLWRLKPELKACSVLIAPADLAPVSASPSRRPTVLERPMTRDALARVLDALADR